MKKEPSSEEIIQILSEESNREKIIINVLNNARKTMYEIGTNNPEIWLIGAHGSYIDRDPMGRWPRIVLPKCPYFFIQKYPLKSRGVFAHEPSDFDVCMFIDDSYTPETDFFNSLEKRPTLKEPLKKFIKDTGVWVHYVLVYDIQYLGKDDALKSVFNRQNREYEVMFERR